MNNNSIYENSYLINNSTLQSKVSTRNYLFQKTYSKQECLNGLDKYYQKKPI